MGFESTVDVASDLKKIRKAKEQKQEQKPQRKKGKRLENKIKTLEPHRTKIYLAVIITLSFLLFSATAQLPIADKLGEEYTRTVLERTIAPQIQEQNPFLPAAAKQEELERAVREAMKTEQARQASQERTEIIKEYYQNPGGTTYPFNYDSYFWLKKAEDLMRKGNENILEVEGEFMPYIISGVAHLTDFSEPDIIKGAFWTPVLLGVLACVMLFFLAKTLFDTNTAFLSSLAFTIHPATFSVFHGGTADTQSTNLLLSIAIILLFIKLYRAAPKAKQKPWKTILYLTGIAVLLKIFKMTWSGWFYIIPIMLAAAALHIIIISIKKKKWIYSAGVTVAILASAWLLRGHHYVARTLSRLNLKETTGTFPTAWKTVSELQGLSIPEYIGIMNFLFMGLAITGFVVLAKKQYKNPDEKIILLPWAGLTILPLLSGRFYMYCLPPLAILAGNGMYRAGAWLSRMDFGLTQKLSRIAWTGLLTFFLVLFLLPQTFGEMNQYPYADDAIYELSQEIRVETQPNTIITTWWDYGYICQYFANRPVTFDGGSFQPERLYWVSRLLLESNEDKAAGILKMLNCRGEKRAFNQIQKPPEEAINILEEAVTLDREGAKEFYAEKGVREVTQHTHCEAPPGILLLSNDMLDLLASFNHFASWNFQYGVSVAKDKRYGRGNCYGKRCDGGLVFDLEQRKASVSGQEPGRFIYVSRNFTNRTEINGSGDFSVLVVEDRVYYLEPGLENTMLFRGLFLNDLEKFELFSLKDERKRLVAYTVNY